MSSVLETFMILFESNASDVEKGNTEAKRSTDKLEASLKSTNTTANKLGSSFTNLIRQASGALLALVSVGAIIGGIKAAVTYADRLDELSKALNVNIEDLSAWGDAVQRNGGTAEGFQETVKSMTAALADFATTGKSRAAPFFEELGIKMVDSRGKARNFLDLLPEIADSFQKLSKAESFGIGQKMGLDQGTIMLLQQGRREVDAVIKRQKELGVVTKEDAEIAAKFNDQWDDTAHAFRTLFVTIGSTVLPAFTSVLKFFEKAVTFFRSHSDLIIGGLIAIGTTITLFILPALKAAIITFGPFLLIGAGIAAIAIAFALLYDDVMNFYKGNKSVLGELIQKWPVVGKILKFIENEVRALIKIFTFLGSTIIDIGKYIIDNLVNSVKIFIKSIMAAIEMIMGAYNKVKSFLGFGDSNVDVSVNKGQKAIAAANTSQIAAQTSNSINSSNKVNTKNTSVQTGPITVHTQATDADGIAGAIGTSMNVQMRQTVNNFDDGMLA